MSRHVIVCTNDQTLVESVSFALETPPRLTVLDSGLQVLAAVDVVHADLLVMDLETPGLNPLLLTSAIRALAPALTILAVSGRAPEDGRVLSHKGVSFLLLPADRGAWRQAIAAAIREHGLGAEVNRFDLHAGTGAR